jgi:ribosomal RNA assembly protein
MYVNVPDDRFNLLKNKMKDKLEYETGADISIDDEVKTVNIKHSNSIKELDTKLIIEAISMGFSLPVALQLIRNPVSRFEKIDIRELTKHDREFDRQMGRIIGKDGRTKELISELTETNIVIKRDIVGVLGSLDDVMKARDAILQLIDGTPHSRVYNDLEKYKSQKSIEVKNLSNSKV